MKHFQLTFETSHSAVDHVLLHVKSKDLDSALAIGRGYVSKLEGISVLTEITELEDAD